MSMKKTLISTVAGFVLLAAGRYLFHEVILAKTYLDTADIWRPRDVMMHRIWVVQLANLIFALAATLIYQRGVESKPWIGQGIRFGILLAMVSAVPQALVEYFTLPIPHTLALHWILGEGFLAVLLSLVIAAICQPEK